MSNKPWINNHDQRKLTNKERLLQKVKINDDTGCWEWQAGKNLTGYGHIHHRGKPRNKSLVRAHRYSWILYKGEIPKGIYVLHKCDNRGCVNPDHLYLGDQFDNMKDMIKRGRVPSRRGENNGCAKLTEKEVLEIRRIHKSKQYTQVHIAKEFNISPNTISKIVNNEIWEYLNE